MQNARIMGRSGDCCGKCGSGLTLVHFQKYCSQCMECPVMLEEDVKVVPNNYRPNSQDFKFTVLVRVEEHVRDFLNRLNIAQPHFNINALVDKVLYMHKKRGLNCKGYREETAAVIFHQFDKQHKMTIHQFCKANSVVLKKFNKMYLEYKRILLEAYLKESELKSAKQQVKLQSSSQMEDQIIKEEVEVFQEQQSMEGNVGQNNEAMNIKSELLDLVGVVKKNESDEEEEMENKRTISPSQRETDQQNAQSNTEECQPRTRELITQTINRLYDHIFTSVYLQKIKPILKARMIEKVLIVEEGWEQNIPIKEYFRIPYIIFGVIKYYKYRISCKQYIEIVRQVLEVNLVDRKLGSIAKVCKRIISKKDGGEQLTEMTSLDNHTFSIMNNS